MLEVSGEKIDYFHQDPSVVLAWDGHHHQGHHCP